MTATTPETAKLAATLEAETLERAGQITFSQARARIRDGMASPVAHLALAQTEALHTALAALRELHSVCVLMDHPDQDSRPTEDEYQSAMAGAARVLGRH